MFGSSIDSPYFNEITSSVLISGVIRIHADIPFWESDKFIEGK